MTCPRYRYDANKKVTPGGVFIAGLEAKARGVEPKCHQGRKGDDLSNSVNTAEGYFEQAIQFNAWRHREGQQQVLRATFPGIRDCVRELIRVRMDALAFRFHQRKDWKISDEIYRLAGELTKPDGPWEFRV